MKMPFPPDTPYDNHDHLQTLCELKAGAESAQELGAQIVALPARHFQKIPLEGQLLAAIVEARRLTGGEAKRRQGQFIGKLMRSVDLEPLRQALAGLHTPDPVLVAEAKHAQEWSDRLATEDGTAVEAFLQVAARADRTRLSQLIRQLRKDQKSLKPSRAQRELLSYVHGELTRGPELDELSA